MPVIKKIKESIKNLERIGDTPETRKAILSKLHRAGFKLKNKEFRFSITADLKLRAEESGNIFPVNKIQIKDKKLIIEGAVIDWQSREKQTQQQELIF